AKAVLTAVEGDRSTDLADPLAAVDTTAERLAKGENVEAWSGLSAYLPEAIVTELRQVIAPATTVEITRNAGLPLPFRRTSDLLATLPPEPPWLWEGFVAGGIVTLLAGIWKGGKSTLVFALLDALRRAAPLFELATTATPVVYLTEEPVWTVDEKVKQWALDDSIIWLQHTETAEMKWATVVAEAVQAAKEAEAKLLIVDTLPQWARLRGETENHSGEMLAAVRPLQIAAQKHGLAVLILTHHR